jgi:hypothetical protein
MGAACALRRGRPAASYRGELVALLVALVAAPDPGPAGILGGCLAPPGPHSAHAPCIDWLVLLDLVVPAVPVPVAS